MPSTQVTANSGKHVNKMIISVGNFVQCYRHLDGQFSARANLLARHWGLKANHAMAPEALRQRQLNVHILDGAQG